MKRIGVVVNRKGTLKEMTNTDQEEIYILPTGEKAMEASIYWGPVRLSTP